MSKVEMEQHANTYSKAFNLEDYKKLQAGQIPEKDMWKYSSYWYKDFNGMAFKTILRRLISKYGVMSIEMQDAYTKDMAVLHENGDYDYVDNPVQEANTTEETEDNKQEDEVHSLDEVK